MTHVQGRWSDIEIAIITPRIVRFRS